MKLKKIGHPIPENDIWVAATCLEVGIPLLTRDGHFDYIRDLEVINWEEQQERIIFDNRTQMNADNQDFKLNFGTKPEVKRKASDNLRK